MEDPPPHQGQEDPNNTNNTTPTNDSDRSASEPVRSRWIPKPEQILILESIFNSGMVNPPKEETVRIRKLLEKFGSVGDANVFYWFQNRRSRSRRRQRQLQASLDQRNNSTNNYQVGLAISGGGGGSGGHGAIPYGMNCGGPAAPSTAMGFGVALPMSYAVGGSSSSSSSSCGQHLEADPEMSQHHASSVCVDAQDDHFFSVSGQMGFPEIGHNSGVTLGAISSHASSLHFQSGLITVFINGIPTDVPKGSFDMKAVFGQDVLLVHSSGVPLPVNDFGFLPQSLQPGESYFLVSRPT